MKNFYKILFATSFLFSLNTYATTVSSFQGLTDALGTADANVVFDATGIQNIDGWMTVNEGQSVALQNIASWTNTPQEFEYAGNSYTAGLLPHDVNKAHLIQNNGSLSINNMTVEKNEFLLNGGYLLGGAVLQNKGVVTELSGLKWSNNNINTFKAQDIWGGILNNFHGAKIQTIKDSSFINNFSLTQQSAPHGAIIYNEGEIDLIENVVFQGNTMQATENQPGGGHGTAIDNNEYSVINKISNVKFINNRSYKPGQNQTYKSNHASGGAMDNYNFIGEISDSLFMGNSTEIEQENVNGSTFARGGAIMLTASGSTAIGTIEKIKKVQFIENFTKNIYGEARGGAIATSGNSLINEMTDVLFEKNYAQGDGLEDGSGHGVGGAIHNLAGTIKTLNGEFKDNYAISKYAKAQGGAIWNGGAIESIKDSEFTGNYATGGSESLGGAIYNIGTIGFEGTNIFKNNKTSGLFNDIHNDGTMIVSGDLTLDGGVTGTGDITFKEGSSLTAELNKTTILANSVTFEGNNKLSFVIGGDIESKTYDFIEASLTGSENVSIKENILYDLSLTKEGSVAVTKKDNNEIKDTLSKNMNKESSEIVTAVLTSKGSDKLRDISSEVSKIIQEGSFEKASKGAKELAPTDSAVVGQVAQSTNALLLNTVGDRVVGTGRSGGDAFKNSSLWMKALYSNAEQDSSSASEGFEADTKGFVFGIDGKATEDLRIGVGYAYTQSEIDAGSREMDVDGHNAFAYAHYQPNKWYVNGMVSYGQSKYKETKTPFSTALRAEYDVKTYGATLMSGYNLENGITPEVGFRYLVIDQESYNDGVQTIDVDKIDFLTAVVGAKFNTTTQINDWVVEPNAKIYATYDLINDDSVASVSFTEGAGYQIKGESLDRFGIETGLGISATLNNIELSLDYLGGFKKDYQNHSGIIKAKYHF